MTIALHAIHESLFHSGCGFSSCFTTASESGEIGGNPVATIVGEGVKGGEA
jgi:hypothetical protein